MKLYVIDKDAHPETELADLSASSLVEASALTFITKNKLYIHRGSTTTLFLVDITDLLSPVVTELGDCPKCGGGMALCKDGNLYSVNINELYIIDPTDLENPTWVGSLGFNTGNLGMTCHPTTDELYVFAAAANALYTLDKADGYASVVGPSDYECQGGVGLEFDPKEPYTLYASLDVFDTQEYYLFTIDPASGATVFHSYLSHGNKNLGARIVP